MQRCHFPFLSVGRLHHACTTDATPGGQALDRARSWCAVELDPATSAPDAWGVCAEERAVAYGGGAEGHVCNVPFHMGGQ